MTTATKITLSRIFMIPVFMTFMYLGNAGPNIWMLLSLIVFILASVTDYIDGYIARSRNQVSNLGKFLDPLADKVLVIAAMCVFCQWNMWPAWALMIILTREFAVTGLRLVAVGNGTVIAAGWSGKVKTACTMVGLCCQMAFPQWVLLRWVVIVLVTVTTVYSGIEYFVKNWKCLWSNS